MSRLVLGMGRLIISLAGLILGLDVSLYRLHSVRRRFGQVSWCRVGLVRYSKLGSFSSGLVMLLRASSRLVVAGMAKSDLGKALKYRNGAKPGLLGKRSRRGFAKTMSSSGRLDHPVAGFPASAEMTVRTVA